MTMPAAMPEAKEDAGGYVARGGGEDFVTLRLGEQMFGIPVLAIQDVLRYQPVARVPLAPPVVAGLLNLRGRIVTAVDLRRRLGLPPREDDAKAMNVVVEHRHELYSLMVDSVGDVLSLPPSCFEKVPANMEESWKPVVSAVCKLERGLLVILDVPNLMKLHGAP